MKREELFAALGEISEYFERCADNANGKARKHFEHLMQASDEAAVQLRDLGDQLEDLDDDLK